MREQQQAGKARVIGYAVGIVLAMIAVVWRLLRYAR
jgi:tetrahydromethanopterin S-methyltransferase subunit F